MAEALRLRDVSVKRGSRTVVEALDLTAQTGEVLAILGPNGAGKTTMLKAIAGLLPYSGRIDLAGCDQRSLSPQARARLLTFVPQQTLLRAALPARRVVEQGRYAHRGSLNPLTREDRQAVERAIETADVAHLSDRPFSRLSFGEQRRVLLARGLATGAQVLCLDEPTASLDIGHALSLYALIRRLAEAGHCVVVVLHQLDDALQHTDRALLLDNGRSIGQGPTPEIVNPDNVARVYGVRMSHGQGLRFSLPTVVDEDGTSESAGDGL